MKRFAFNCFAFLAGALVLAASLNAQEPVAVALPTGGTTPEARAAVPANPAVPANAATPKIKVQPLTVTLQLIDPATRFTGTLSGLDQWPMKTSFGETNVPLSAVAGIKFAGEGNPSTTIVLHNGDSITGALDLHHVLIETAWGKAEVDSGHINSMMFTPGLGWTSEQGLGGTRWKLVSEKNLSKLPSANVAATSAVNHPPAASAVAQPVPGAIPSATPPGYAQPVPRPASPLVIGR